MQSHNKLSQHHIAATDGDDDADVELFKTRSVIRASTTSGRQQTLKLRGHTMPRQIYAIYDNVAQDIIGGLHLHPHQAPAIRMFGDIAKLPNSQIALHPQDFDLILLGTLLDDCSIEASKKVIPIITGAAWVAAQQHPTGENDAS